MVTALVREAQVRCGVGAAEGAGDDVFAAGLREFDEAPATAAGERARDPQCTQRLAGAGVVVERGEEGGL